VVVACTVIFAPGAWAKPKFKVLASVPGGLWSGFGVNVVQPVHLLNKAKDTAEVVIFVGNVT